MLATEIILETDPDRAQFAHLRYPPFVAEIGDRIGDWGDLGLKAILKVRSDRKALLGKGIDQLFALLPDSTNCPRTEPILPASSFA